MLVLRKTIDWHVYITGSKTLQKKPQTKTNSIEAGSVQVEVAKTSEVIQLSETSHSAIFVVAILTPSHSTQQSNGNKNQFCSTYFRLRTQYFSTQEFQTCYRTHTWCYIRTCIQLVALVICGSHLAKLKRFLEK